MAYTKQGENVEYLKKTYTHILPQAEADVYITLQDEITSEALHATVIRQEHQLSRPAFLSQMRKNVFH